MKKRILACTMLFLAALILSGCAMRTVEEMYHVPKRSEESTHLQAAIDMGMAMLDYAAPLSGENQQAVQATDLNGDGVDEYLVYAIGTSEKPMKIMILEQNDQGTYQIAEIIDSNGTAFEQVEYVDVDGHPGNEIIVGRQVSDQVMRSVSVYTFANGNAEQLLSVGYSKLLTCDMDDDGDRELMVIQQGDSNADNGIAMIYSYHNGVMARSMEAELSEKPQHIKRIMVSRLFNGSPAVYVASSADGNNIVTDIFALREGRFVNVSTSNAFGTSVETLRNYYVYADDVDNDGIMELPNLITMEPVHDVWSEDEQYLLRWYAMDIGGQEVDKLYSFHNFAGGWYVQLDSAWATRVTVEQQGNTYTFYAWDVGYNSATELFTLYALTGSDRQTRATEDGRFALYQTEGVIYAARLQPAADTFGVTEETLINDFHLIRQHWNMGEM